MAMGQLIMPESIAFSLSFEHFLSRLFGKPRYHATTGIRYTTAEWRQELLRIARSIRRAITINVRATDRSHRTELLERCRSVERALEDSTSINDLNLVMIQHLSEISFLLMGASPNHWDAIHPPGPNGWKLSALRNVVYSQTPEQRVQLVLDFALRHDSKLYNQMLDYLASIGTNPNRIDVFLKWVGQKHDALYKALF